MKRLLITLLKIAVSAAILGYLVYDATQGKERQRVRQPSQPAQALGHAGRGLGCCTVAVLLTFVRWWYLVRALEVPAVSPTRIRISFWGYLFNLAPLGIVGGDLVKAVMLGHEHPQHRAKAVASVLVDRVIGLYVLFVVASGGDPADRVLADRRAESNGFAIRRSLSPRPAPWGWASSWAPSCTVGRASRAFGRIPRVGPPLESLIVAVRMYSRKPLVLALSSCDDRGRAQLLCHRLLSDRLRAARQSSFAWAEHFVVMPLSAAMGVIPLAIGPTEFALDFLYASAPAVGPPIAKGQGLSWRWLTG